jgi:Predicted periplasmic lipoprotein (DUF2279)
MFKLLTVSVLLVTGQVLGVRAQQLAAPINATKDSATIASANQVRLQRRITLGAAAVMAGVYTYLGTAWYSGQEKTRFRWFDDGKEWQQIDKVGHAFGAYQESRLMMELLKSAGASPRKILWQGGLTGFVLQAPIEFFDGFAADYGASGWDLAANAFGSGLAIANYALWQEQRLGLKFSYFPTQYPKQRPDLLGSGSDELLKDYNGQTYWLSFPLRPILPTQWLRSRWPRWLGAAVGYGGRGMIGGYGTEPSSTIQAREQREWYLALDIDLTQVKTRSRFLKTIFVGLNAVHLPLPGVRLRGGDLQLLPLAF